MILTTCAACAAPLAYDANHCARCETRYCSDACFHDHWRRGHEQICEEIHRGGNAEQYHADKKYKEAVAEAVEACAEDTSAPRPRDGRRQGASKHSKLEYRLAGITILSRGAPHRLHVASFPAAR